MQVFGKEFKEMRRIADAVADVLRHVQGSADVAIDHEPPLPQLQIEVDREAMARFGVNVSDEADLIEIGIGGKPVGQLFQGERRYERRLAGTNGTPDCVRTAAIIDACLTV